MHSLHIANFRPFEMVTFEIHPHITCIIGDNARGKTSLLEALYVSLTTTGFREREERELMRWGSQQTIVESKTADHMFQVVFNASESTVAKKYFIDKTAKSRVSYRDLQPHAVLFAPEQIEIVTGTPSVRRNYINTILCLADPVYSKKLRAFEEGLRKRNKILEDWLSLDALKNELKFWDDMLCEASEYLVKVRTEYVSFLNQHNTVHEKEFKMVYTPNPFTKEKALEKLELETRTHKTMFGPQRDEYVIEMKLEVKGSEMTEFYSVALYGSRSQQRLAVYWLKLNEIYYSQEVLKKSPFLLLDDVFSELDSANKKLILDTIGKYQSVLTTTESVILEELGDDCAVIRL